MIIILRNPNPPEFQLITAGSVEKSTELNPTGIIAKAVSLFNREHYSHD